MRKRGLIISVFLGLFLLILTVSFTSAQQYYYNTTTCTANCNYNMCGSGCCDPRIVGCNLGTAGILTDQSSSTYSGSCSGSVNICDGTNRGWSCSGSCTATNTVTNVPICTESWTCTAFGNCQNGQETRTCTDSNACGTTTNKPAETQSAVCDVTAPVVAATFISPVAGTAYRTPQTITIGVSVTDDVVVTSAKAEIRLPDGSASQLNLPLVGGNNYAAAFPISQFGVYSVNFVAVDGSNNVNNAVTTSFVLIACEINTALCNDNTCAADCTSHSGYYNGGCGNPANEGQISSTCLSGLRCHNGLCEPGTQCGIGQILCNDNTCAADCTSHSGYYNGGCGNPANMGQSYSCQSGLICFGGTCQPASCSSGTTRCNDGTCQSNPLCPNNGGPFSQCSSARTSYTFLDPGNVGVSQSTMNGAACAGQDRVNGTIDDCCPSGWSCSTSNVNPGCKLYNVTDTTARCSFYTTQSACQNDSRHLSPNDPAYSIYNCGTTNNTANTNTLCSCSWDYPTNSCAFGKTTRTSTEPIAVISKCVYGSVLGECSAGYQTVDITILNSTGFDPACTPSTRTVPCLRSTIQLPFFGAMQFMLSMIAIALLYLIMFGIKTRFIKFFYLKKI